MAEGWKGVDPSVWADVSATGLTALLRNSVQGLAKEAGNTIPNGGLVPVKTGNLARSVVVDTKPPQVIEGAAVGDYSLGVAAIKPGDKIYIGWQAKYSARQNYGFIGTDSLGRTYSQAGYGFAEATAAKWPEIVKAEAAKVKGK